MDNNFLQLNNIANQLKRIADALEESNAMIKEIGGPNDN